MTHSGAWDGILRVLRDPIFALGFSAFLAVLASRPIWRLVRMACLLASIVMLIWLAAHNSSSAHVEVAVVAAVTRVLLILIAALFIVAVIAMAVLLVMYLKSAPAPSSLLRDESTWRAPTSFIAHESSTPSLSEFRESSLGEGAGNDIIQGLILEEGNRFNDLVECMSHLLDNLSSNVDYDNPVRACAEIIRIYFSGLSAHSAEIAKLHEECNMSIRRIMNALTGTSYSIHPRLRAMSKMNWFPTSGEWAEVTEEAGFRMPYLALRVTCLKTDWRAVAMIMFKSSACLMLLTKMDEL